MPEADRPPWLRAPWEQLAERRRCPNCDLIAQRPAEPGQMCEYCGVVLNEHPDAPARTGHRTAPRPRDRAEPADRANRANRADRADRPSPEPPPQALLQLAQQSDPTPVRQPAATVGSLPAAAASADTGFLPGAPQVPTVPGALRTVGDDAVGSGPATGPGAGPAVGAGPGAGPEAGLDVGPGVGPQSSASSAQTLRAALLAVYEGLAAPLPGHPGPVAPGAALTAAGPAGPVVPTTLAAVIEPVSPTFPVGTGPLPPVGPGSVGRVPSPLNPIQPLQPVAVFRPVPPAAVGPGPQGPVGAAVPGAFPVLSAVTAVAPSVPARVGAPAGAAVSAYLTTPRLIAPSVLSGPGPV